MMLVEDLLIKIRDKMTIDVPKSWFTDRPKSRAFQGTFDQWSQDFIIDVAKYADDGRALSAKQAKIVLGKISSLRDHLIEHKWISKTDLDTMLSSPSYRLPPYESIYVPKEVRHVGDNILAFRCRANKQVSDPIKALSNAPMTISLCNLRREEQEFVGSGALKVRFDWYHKLWIVPVHRFNLQAITDLIATHRFEPDGATADYLKAARRSLDQPATASISDEDEVILVHVADDPLLAAWITEMAEGVAI